MGKRIHGKVRKGRKMVWCSGRMKAVSIYRGGGQRCDCGVRWFCW